MDGNRASFSDTEKRAIIAIWRYMAEDFAPFEVGVTTEDDGLSLSGRGVRVAIGGAWADWLGSPAGGIAYVGQWSNTYYQPAFVFPESLGRSPKSIAEATSHEVGHTLGLGHDATASVGYYSGHNGWGPIMGVAYSQQLSQWSKGEYSGANNPEDDLSKISEKIATRADDHGNTAAAATALAGPSRLEAGVNRTSLSVTGTIERTADVDYMRFTSGAGGAKFTVGLVPLDTVSSATRTWTRSNLDLRMDLYVAGALDRPLASWNPSDGLLSGTYEFTLPGSNTYYLALQGVGQGANASVG